MRSHVDLPTLAALQAEWQQHPPVHHLVAAYLDYKPPADAQSPEHQESLQQLMAMMPTTTNAPRLDTSAWDGFAQAPEPEHG